MRKFTSALLICVICLDLSLGLIKRIKRRFRKSFKIMRMLGMTMKGEVLAAVLQQMLTL